MITALQSILKNYVYKLFLWVFLIVLLATGLSFDYSDNRPWAFKVYKQKATELDYRQAIDATQRQYDYFKAQGLSWPRTESIEKEVLRRMVVDLLIKDLGTHFHLQAPYVLVQEKLAQQLSGLPEYFFNEQGQLNVAMLEKVLAPKTFTSFLQDLEKEIEADLLYGFVSISGYVPQFEVMQQLQEEYADKKYSILKFTLDKALQKVKAHKVADETLERFYKKSEHGQIYKTAEQRAGRYWKFNQKDYGLTISSSDINQYYDKHKQAEFLETPAQVQIHRIYFEQHDNYDAKAQAQTVHDQVIQDPSTFAQVAKKIASAKLSHQGSEKTDFFAKDSTKYDKILVDTAFEELAEDLAISQVIKTDKGYEVIQRLARKSAKYKTLHDVSAQIKEKLSEEKFAKRFKQDADRLVTHASYNKESFNDFIKKRHGNKEELSLQERKSGLITQKLFQLDAGQYEVFMDGKDGIILECTHIEKSTLKPFDVIKDQVRQDYYKKMAEEELKNMTLQALKDAAGKNLVDYAQKHKIDIEHASARYTTGQMDQDAILRRPEVSAKIKVLQTAGSMIDVVTSTEGLVICLDEISKIDEENFATQKETTELVLASKAKYKGRETFIASLYRHAKLNNKIEIKEQLFKDIKDAEL